MKIIKSFIKVFYSFTVHKPPFTVFGYH